MQLNDKAVHVWWVDLEDPRWDIFACVLSREEVVRARSLSALLLQQRFSRCRATLRLLLAGYANETAGTLRLQYGRYGKPELAEWSGHFNVSHSGSRAVMAMAMTPVGVDVECKQTSFDMSDIISVLCSPDEAVQAGVLSASAREKFLFSLWTRKEAYCKAVGIGLHRALHGIRFERTSRDAWRVRDSAANSGEAYFVHDLDTGSNYAASVCVSETDPQVISFNATPENLVLLQTDACGGLFNSLDLRTAES